MYPYVSFLTLLISLATVHADGDFTATCSRLKLDYPSYVLTAECKRTDASTVTSTLNLNNCLVNQGGGLLCRPGGGFSGTCDISNDLTDTSVITGTCALRTNNKNVNSYTSFDLNDCIGNHDGVLAC